MGRVTQIEILNELVRFDPSLDMDAFDRFMMNPDSPEEVEPMIGNDVNKLDVPVRASSKQPKV